MTTLKSEFVDLADELIGDEFADFAVSTVISKLGTASYATQSETATTETINTIRLDYKKSQFDGQLIAFGDYMLIGQLALLSEIPSPDNFIISRESKTLNLLRVEVDPANATVLMHVRPQ